MPVVTFRRHDHFGEIVIDGPPLNLFSVELLTDLRAAVDNAADSGLRALLLRAGGMISPPGRRSRSSSDWTRSGLRSCRRQSSH
jgi:hypothetical protein